MSNSYLKINLIIPTFRFKESDILHHGRVKIKEISFNNRFSLTSNNRYVNLVLVIFGFGIQIEIKE